ncbi:hypothetical protein Tco_1409416 [Tanacetum coccineum]
MMMCKQAEQGVPLQAEQADWLEDTDEEIDEQELEAHYSYMAKIKENKQNEFEKYKAFNDRTIDYEILQTKLNETLGLLALKDIEIKEGYLKENTKVISDLKVKEEKDIDKMIEMDKQLKFLNEIVYTRNQSIQTIHISTLKCHGLYEIPYDTSDPANRFAPEREETMTLDNESRSKLNKDYVKPYDYTNQNSLYEIFKGPSLEYLYQLERAKEVRKTIVSRPQLKCYQVKDKVVPNNSQVKFTKKEVEDHHRISNISKKTKYVTAYNDNSNSRTSNVNVVCPKCGKCVFNSNHDACVSKYLNDVNARTKKPKVVPISASKPKRKTNKSVATPHKKAVASDTTIQKPKSYFKELPSLKWKPTGRIFSNVRLRWIPTGKLLNSCTGKVESEPTHGSNVDIPHIHACKQTLGLSAGTSFNGQKQQRIDLNADALYNAKQENLRVWLLKLLISKKPVPECSGLVLHQMTSAHNRSELGIHVHNNEPSSSKLVPKVVPLAVKTATSRQELELLFHHHIAMLRTTDGNLLESTSKLSSWHNMRNGGNDKDRKMANDDKDNDKRHQSKIAKHEGNKPNNKEQENDQDLMSLMTKESH